MRLKNFSLNKKTSLVGFLLVLFFITIFIVPHAILAAGEDIVSGTEAVGEATGLGNEDPRIIIARIIRIAFGFIGAVFLSLVI